MTAAARAAPRRHRVVADPAALPSASFDDIIYFGSDAERIERLQGLLATGGVIDIVQGGAPIGRAVAVDVGRIHYDLTRWVGTTGSSAADGYAMAPADGELRAGDRVAVIGAAGPMGFMHVIRTASSALPGLSLTAIDIDVARLAHLARSAGPLAASRGIPAVFVNSRTTQVEPGFTLRRRDGPGTATRRAGGGAGGPLAPGSASSPGSPPGPGPQLDLDAVITNGIYLFGTSGSRIPDMQAVLRKLENGELDTNISVDAITGMEGVRDALDAVEARTSGGKIVVYPSLHDLGMVRLSELPARFPTVAAGLADGQWTRAAEDALLAVAADQGAAARPGAGAE